MSRTDTENLGETISRSSNRLDTQKKADANTEVSSHPHLRERDSRRKTWVLKNNVFVNDFKNRDLCLFLYEIEWLMVRYFQP